MKTRINLILVVLLAASFAAFAQKGGSQQKGNPQSGGSQNSGSDCFKEWFTLIRERGAATVTDGTHDVILTLRNTQDGSSTCFMGRAEVAGGRIKRPILVQKEDGSFEPFATLGKGLDPGFAKSMSEDEMFAISDGMSINFNLSGGEFARVFFYTFINSKPKGLKQAPSPKTLVKN